MNSSIISERILRDLLPQKSPFVMLDRLVSFDDNNIITGFLIKEDNIFIENNRFNESGMIENIAQSVALHTGYYYYLKKEKSPIGYIGSISKIQVFGYPKMSENIITEINIITEFMGVTLVEGKLYSNDELLMCLRMKTYINKDD